MCTDFDILREQLLQDPEVKREYEALEPDFNIVQAIIVTRTKKNLTQKELALKTGISLANIRKLEAGNGNPTLSLLKKLADGMDMTLKLEFIPKSE